MYTVVHMDATSPKELEGRLNKLCKEYKLELIAVDNGYYIFKAL